MIESYLFVNELVEEFNSMFHIEKIELKKFNEFNQMGIKSHDIYNNKFQLDKVISEFILDFNKYMKV